MPMFARHAAPAPVDEPVVDLERKESGVVQLEDKTTAEPQPIDPELEKRINRKFDVRVLPWLFGIWLLAYIDKTNIGNARIDGLGKELKLTGDKFNITLCVFFVPYICVNVPSTLVLRYFNAGWFLPGIITGWGLVSMCTGFVTSYGGLIACRFFLGLCEGGLTASMVLYISMFYPRHQMMRRITIYYCAAPLSGAFGGLLATGLAQINTSRYHGWPFIFFVEGAITVIFGIVAACFMPHSPAQSRFLTEEEREAAINRMYADVPGSVETEDKFSWYWFRQGIWNVNTIVTAINTFALITPLYSFSLFLPTIISAMGYSKVHAQLLTVPPNMVAFFIVLIVGYTSDKMKMRGPLVIVGSIIAIAGYVMLISTDHHNIQYGGTFLVAAGIFPSIPLLMCWLPNNLTPHFKRATGGGFQIMICNLAAFLATFTYIEKNAPRYISGHAINIGMIGLSLCCTTFMMIYNSVENKKRARGGRDYRLAGDVSQLGDKHPAFRYTL